MYLVYGNKITELDCVQKYQFGLKLFPNEKQILGYLFKILKYVQLFENGLKMDGSTGILKNTLKQKKIA